MNDAKIEKQKAKLVKAGLMDEKDTLIDFLQASYIERLIGKMGKWKQGWAYFTETRLIIVTGILNADIIIPYKNIQKLEKCSQSFMPIGIAITHEDMESGKVMIDKISMMKRDKWLKFLVEKTGINA